MQHNFSYNSTAYWLKKYPKRYLFRRVMAVICVIMGIVYFTPWIWERSLTSIVFGTLLIITGLVEFISPLWMYKLFNSSDHQVTIDDTKIKWKETFFQRPSVLRFDQVVSYKVYNGQIHFTTTDGTIVKLNHYIIEDEEMQRQFLELLQKRLAGDPIADLVIVNA